MNWNQGWQREADGAIRWHYPDGSTFPPRPVYGATWWLSRGCEVGQSPAPASTDAPSGDTSKLWLAAGAALVAVLAIAGLRSMP